MLQWRPISFCAVLAVLIGLSVWGLSGLTRHIIITVDRWGSAAPSAGKTDAVLDHLNRPCKGTAGPDACGTLAQINKTVITAGDAIVTTQLVERAAEPHIVAAMDEFSQTAKHLSGTADSLSLTVRAATGTFDAATLTLGEGQRTIAAAQPLLTSYTTAGNSLNDLLRSRQIYGTLDNVNAMTLNANGILADGRKVADKATADYLTPQPWWKKGLRYSGDAADVGALFARHIH